MKKAKILFADNDLAFLSTRSEFLEKEGYAVIQATNPSEARKVLEAGNIDLAILDIRLEDDDDEKDVSGLTLAKESVRTIPKIMLTNFPTVDAVREVLKPQLDGLPAAVEFVSKEDGPEVLIWAIRRTIDTSSTWLKKVQAAISDTDNELKEDYNHAQRQANANYIASLIVAFMGIIMIFFGIALAYAEKLDPSIPVTVGGIVTEVVGYLFFTRVDKANKRMDIYHAERIQGQRLEILIHSCDGLDTDQIREQCRLQIITAATEEWFRCVSENREVKN